MDKSRSHFAENYAAARKGFLAAARGHGVAVESDLLPAFKGAQGEDLAIDTALLGAADAPALLIITSATHGVEGFCGSGCQRALFEDTDMRRRLDAGKVALLLVHGVNPYGFSHLRRVNEDNVDLNRNFRDFADTRESNPAYAAVHALLVPSEWPSGEGNRADMRACMQKMGAGPFQAAVSAGQRTYKDGLFHCGTQPAWSNRTVRSIVRRHGAARSRIGWIDLHTGLGPYGHGEKIYAGANEAAELARARAWYGADVMSYYDGKSASAEVSGSMVMSIYAECPHAEATGMGLEYGTRPFAEVLDAIRGDHWLAIHPEAHAARRAQIKRTILDAFYIDADDWKGMVLGQARTAVLQAVSALSSK
ncbi:MAG: DUF2817 domain-containing protein [Betaproteobacteria bacterium]|nr:DUF2817 domain-containing protein [Betaproteobacteria bacterium]